MKKAAGGFFKRAYFSSPIMQFLVSYVSVLTIPVAFVLIALQFTFSFITENAMISNMTVLDHSKQLMDLRMDSIQTLAGYMVCDKDLNELIKTDRIENADDPVLLKTLESLADIIDARGNDLLESAYVILRRPKKVLYKRGVYSFDDFTGYIKNFGIEYSFWEDRYCNYDKKLPFFLPSRAGIDYIVPFGVDRDGKNCGTVVCNISSGAMKNILDFSEEYGSYSFFLVDEIKNKSETPMAHVLWSEDFMSRSDLLQTLDLSQRRNMKMGRGLWIIYTQSEQYGWSYVLAVSSDRLLNKFNRLRLILILMLMFTVAVGLFISSFLAVKKGKPVKDIFDSLESHYFAGSHRTGHEVRDMASLEKLFERLFDSITAVRKEDLFYPEVLEAFLCSNIRSGNFEAAKSIVLMIEKENFENRTCDAAKFSELNAKICSALMPFEALETVSDRRLDSLKNHSLPPEDYRKYFDELLNICESLCENSGRKKNMQRKDLAQKIKSYLDDNYAQTGLCLTMVSEKFAVSESYISMIYKEQLGVNFADYLEKTRIEKACELLAVKNNPIENIAFAVGYSSASSFRRAFKRVTGKTPKVYR
ncbi:helix-turn-helix domain-containing protein [Treponema parvum]|uniref:helix-turn-helix domain-containing protein n=1 Tax=Treponema parvum TaxID=138851 RepID=UPI001AEC5886|nr:AraC family transcriptional regulator [Treponema parvum]QTQ15594.1 AraC family transcriptional regulator [Treponema parvum]